MVMVIGIDGNNGNGDYFKSNGNASVCSIKRILLCIGYCYTQATSVYIIVHVHVVNLVECHHSHRTWSR